ncbi:hypothetical protein [Pedobacter sp. SYSU D00535]|uniref:hypothetical protein n=1 Tax=Pedobacter sp. SYSU D00535 TaxID=2810308 RepID=UPI001A96E099|nr:hypothetical protein [Pedobacter sp. SYSU D00535]
MEHTFKNSSFLFLCKENFCFGIYPNCETSRETDGYKAIVQLARSFFDAGLLNEFAEYLEEGPYLSQLWAATLILDYGQPSEDLKQQCLQLIEKNELKYA